MSVPGGATAGEAWLVANHRYLLGEIERVQRQLERHAARARPQPATAPRPAPEEVAPTDRVRPALRTLCESFSLTAFERDLVLLCAGFELDAAFRTSIAAAQALPGVEAPTFGLALAALPDAHWSALAPHGPLREACLIHLGPGEGLTSRPLRLDERVLHYLTGLLVPPGRDERLPGLLSAVAIPADAASALPPSHQALARQVAARLGDGAGEPVLLCGPDAAERQGVAAAACARLGLRLVLLHASEVPRGPGERDLLRRLWRREALLCPSALLLACEGDEARDAARPVLDLLGGQGGLGGPVLVSCREPLHGEGLRLVRFDVERPPAAEQRQLFEQALGPAAAALNGPLEGVLSHFSLGPQAIAAVSSLALVRSADQGTEALGAELWRACRGQARPALDELAQRIEPAAGFAELVLPEPQRETLRLLIAHRQHQATVLGRWGFERRSDRGLGISALFVGGSGTGKTLAAEVVAHELRLDLYRVDLAQVVSKYIGETEKNLRRVFDAAEAGGAVLLFDEADALFGKRTEVRDSHDRFANIEVSYLLSRMEAFRGVSILTSNMKAALDGAFLRRLRFVVQFPFPEPEQRIELWRRSLPPAAPTEGLDFEKLARLSIAGGHIRNIALHAAFLAAASGDPIRMPHLLAAARSEYTKLEKPLPASEIGGWV